MSVIDASAILPTEWFSNRPVIFVCRFVLLFSLYALGFSVAYANCAETGYGSDDGLWYPAQNYPIGPASVSVYPQKFMPAGTVLFDQIYPMGSLLGNSEAVVAKCTDTKSASTVSAALRLDDTYQYGSFLVGATKYYFTQYVYPSDTPDPMHTTVGWKLYGVMADGSQRELIFNDDTSSGNTAVVFPASGNYEISTRSDKATYPYVVKAKHFPSVRLVLVRSPYDDNNFVVVSDGYIGRIGIAHTDYGGGSTDATFGYIKFGNYQPATSVACGVIDVPRTVDLGSHPVSTIHSGSVPWTSFVVTYECTTTNSPVGTLRIGFEPQNRGNLVASDSRYLMSDAVASKAEGVGIVYRRQGESGERQWVQNSGCLGISTATQNNSNCYLARSQTQAEGWYQVSPMSSGNSTTAGYTDYTESFEARLEILPNTPFGGVTAGKVSATVNVLVNQP
ncbi:fimbrial protein [Burkholderia ubonensis]|uniref:fimbrial protein n=1 Tax=Burkholderia ubonensis TaxID=101571 RepID=UPI0012F8BD31|nr:fimbrial protein [Burkholderia ubonensis]